MKAISRRDYEKDLQEQARKDFSGHDTYRVISPSQWRIFKPGTSTFWAEIAVMGSAVAVWGDIDGCFFAYGPSSKHPEDVLRWLAGSNLGYAREKASIGMTSIGHETDLPEVALHRLHEMRTEYVEENDDGRFDTLIAAIEESCDQLETGSTVQDLREFLYDHSFDIGEIARIGRVTTARVIYALEAVNKLVQLMGAS
jgi:hypothetical protein